MLIVLQVLEARIPGTGTTVTQHPREEMGHGAKVTKENGEVQSGASAINEAQERKDATIERAKVSSVFSSCSSVCEFGLSGRDSASEGRSQQRRRG